MRNSFLETFYTKCVGENFPRPFSKKSKLSIYLDQQANCFCCMTSLGLLKYIKLSCRPLTFTSFKTFLKNKKRSRTSLSASFSG